MKKYLIILIFGLFFISCDYNTIYSGGKTKYYKTSNEELKKIGTDFELQLEKKYGKVNLKVLKEKRENDIELKQFLLTDEEKIEYDNLLIEGIKRGYLKKKENIKDKEILKKMKKNYYEVIKGIKKLKTREEYINYIFFNNEKLNNIVESN